MNSAIARQHGLLDYRGMDTPVIVSIAACVLSLGLVLSFLFRRRNKDRASKAVPFDELQRRPAGEACRIKLQQLDEAITDNTNYLVLFPILMINVLIIRHPTDIIMPTVLAAFSTISSVYFGKKLLDLIRERSNYQLGYQGERFVGEELSQLIGAGFQVYHDVPFEGFNIDHVLVGTRGVFVVETKTRRKPINESGRKDYRVKFDGRSLQWPWGTDDHGVEQAKNNAKTLSTWLSSGTGESVWATPILTLPGWMVELTAPINGLMVLNPKQIFQVCTSQPEKLSQPQIQRICHQLNQKCRIAVT